MESRTQGSRPRPRTQKKIRGQGQPWQTLSRPRTKDTSALQKKKRSSQKFFRQSPQKNVFQKIFQALHKNLTIQKIVLSSSRGQANFRGLEASRPRTWPSRPRTSKCVLEDSTSANLGPVLNKLMQLMRVTERAWGIEPPTAGQFLWFCGKNSNFNAISITFCKFLKPYEYQINSDVVKTLMVETETKTETWKKFKSKTRDQDLKKFLRPRSRLGEFVRDETSRPEILKAELIRIDYWQPFSWFFGKQTANHNTVGRL